VLGMKYQVQVIRVLDRRLWVCYWAAFQLPHSLLLHALSVHWLLSRGWRRYFVWLQQSLNVFSKIHRRWLWYFVIPTYGLIDSRCCCFRRWPRRSGASALAAWGNQGLPSTAIHNNQGLVQRYWSNLLQISSGMVSPFLHFTAYTVY
jgi:hypothetical protein